MKNYFFFSSLHLFLGYSLDFFFFLFCIYTHIAWCFDGVTYNEFMLGIPIYLYTGSCK